MATSSEAHGEYGPSPVKKYWFIFFILAILTFIEWAAFEYKPIKDSAFYIPILVSAMATKFVLVCGWYMHLRYDNKILLIFYATSIFIAVCVKTALGILLF